MIMTFKEYLNEKKVENALALSLYLMNDANFKQNIDKSQVFYNKEDDMVTFIVDNKPNNLTIIDSGNNWEVQYKEKTITTIKKSDLNGLKQFVVQKWKEYKS